MLLSDKLEEIQDWYEKKYKEDILDLIIDVIEGYEMKNEDNNFWSTPNSKNRERFYIEIMPKHLEVFKKINNYYEENIEGYNTVETNHYDYGIYLIGFSEDPIILSMCYTRPKHIYMIYSSETDDMVKKIKDSINSFDKEIHDKLLESRKNQWIEAIDNASDPVLTFKAIKNAIKKIRNIDKNAKIMVDITGGKKTMVSGAFSSTSLYENVDMVYVDFGDYNKKLRRPVYCTEFITRVQNPNKIFRYTDIERIKGLFNDYKYDAANKEINMMLKKMDFENGKYYEDEEKILKSLKYWSGIYYKWDQYKYSSIFHEKNLERIQEIHKLDNEDIEILKIIKEYTDIDKQINKESQEVNIRHESDKHSYILENLFKKLIDGEIEDQVFKYIIIDRYCNAVRRGISDTQGCIIRLCNIIELVTYYYIILNHNDVIYSNDKSKVNIEKLNKDTAVSIVFGKYSNSTKKEYGKLSSVQDRLYLIQNKSRDVNKIRFSFNRVADNIIDKEVFDNCIELINLRNVSSIVHGIGVVEKQRIKKYLNVVKELIKWSFNITNVEFEALEKKFSFKNYNDIVQNQN